MQQIQSFRTSFVRPIGRTVLSDHARRRDLSPHRAWTVGASPHRDRIQISRRSGYCRSTRSRLGGDRLPKRSGRASDSRDGSGGCWRTGVAIACCDDHPSGHDDFPSGAGFCHHGSCGRAARPALRAWLIAVMVRGRPRFSHPRAKDQPMPVPRPQPPPVPRRRTETAVATDQAHRRKLLIETI